LGKIELKDISATTRLGSGEMWHDQDLEEMNSVIEIPFLSTKTKDLMKHFFVIIGMCFFFACSSFCQEHCNFDMEIYSKEIGIPFTKKIPYHINDNRIAYCADIEIDQRHYYLMRPIVIQSSRDDWTLIDTYIFTYSIDGYDSAMDIGLSLDGKGKIITAYAFDTFDNEGGRHSKQRWYKDKQNDDVLKELPVEIEANMAPFTGPKQAEKIRKIISMHLNAIVKSTSPHKPLEPQGK
jgi:hypothetical protein